MDSRIEAAMQELETKAGIPCGEIFDYRSAALGVIFDRYYNFCQTNLTDHSKEAAIQPALFYFNPVLIDESDELPNLVKNRFRGNISKSG